MTLKERKHWHIKEELEKTEKSEGYKQLDIFYDVCERVAEKVNVTNIKCDTYEVVFELIEKNNVDISDIIVPYTYAEYKKAILESMVRIPPHIGKKPDKVYDPNDPDDYEAIMKIIDERQK